MEGIAPARSWSEIWAAGNGALGCCWCVFGAGSGRMQRADAMTETNTAAELTGRRKSVICRRLSHAWRRAADVPIQALLFPTLPDHIQMLVGQVASENKSARTVSTAWVPCARVGGAMSGVESRGSPS